MKQAYAYLRVSGKSQVEGDGLERQAQTCIAFARTMAFDLVDTFKDEGVSGTIDSLDRPELSECIVRAEREGGCIIVERADRIARDLIVSEIFFRECRARGIEVYAADTGEELALNDADPSRKLIRQILGALAEWEKSVIVKKLASGRARVRRETGRCEGRKPYGQTEYEVTLIEKVRAYRRNHFSVQYIADAFNRNGHKSRDGKKWHASTIRRLIKAHNL